MKNLIQLHPLKIITLTLICITLPGCATTKSKPPANPDLTYTWSTGSGAQERKITTLRKCSDKNCTSIDFKNLSIWLTSTSQPQKSEVEVCHNSSNPFIQHCEVYDCYEDHAAQQSVCDFLYDYNKNCMSEQCSN